jgi:hypothetical protein
VDVIGEDGFYPSKKDYYFDKIPKIGRHENGHNSRCTIIVYFDTGINYKEELYHGHACELVEFLTKVI